MFSWKGLQWYISYERLFISLTNSRFRPFVQLKKTVVYLSLRTCCTCLSLCALIKVFLTLAALTSFDLLNAGSLACFSGVQSRWSGLYKRRCLHLEEQWGKQHFSQLLSQETLALVPVQTLGCIAVQQIKRRRYTAMRKTESCSVEG